MDYLSDDEIEVRDKPLYTGEMVARVIHEAKQYIWLKRGKKLCLDLKNNQTSACSCIFDMEGYTRRYYRAGHDNRLNFHLVCEEMASWFVNARLLEMEFDKDRLDVSAFEEKIGGCVWIRSQNDGRAHTKMVNLTMTSLSGYNGHDTHVVGEKAMYNWDVSDSDQEQQFHASMCLPTTLLVWRMIVGGRNWNDDSDNTVQTWLGRQYEAVLVADGRNLEKQKKQKLRQRLFYARIEDLMAAPKEAKLISYKHCLETFVANKWVDTSGMGNGGWAGVMKEHMRKSWEKWQLNTIHLLRGGSDFDYNQRTKALVERLKIKVESINTANVDFLEKLFTLVGRKNKDTWKRVQPDKKLLFISFKNCHSINSALQAFYSVEKSNSMRGEVKIFMEQEDYSESVSRVDEEIQETLKKMISTGARKVAYQTSLLMSEVHEPQKAHIDYDKQTGNHLKYMIGFLPLTETGQFLQLWDRNQEGKVTVGELVFIPRGQLVLVPGDTIHGGGFRAEHRSDNKLAHLRLHFYV